MKFYSLKRCVQPSFFSFFFCKFTKSLHKLTKRDIGVKVSGNVSSFTLANPQLASQKQVIMLYKSPNIVYQYIPAIKNLTFLKTFLLAQAAHQSFHYFHYTLQMSGISL